MRTRQFFAALAVLAATSPAGKGCAYDSMLSGEGVTVSATVPLKGRRPMGRTL